MIWNVGRQVPTVIKLSERAVDTAPDLSQGEHLEKTKHVMW